MFQFGVVGFLKLFLKLVGSVSGEPIACIGKLELNIKL